MVLGRVRVWACPSVDAESSAVLHELPAAGFQLQTVDELAVAIQSIDSKLSVKEVEAMASCVGGDSTVDLGLLFFSL